MAGSRAQANRAARRWTLIGGALVVTAGLAGAPADATGTATSPRSSDEAPRPATSLELVTRSVGADHLHRWGYDGEGVGVALLDTGTAPVDGLDDPGQVVHGPDLSTESSDPELAHVDTYGHGTHMAGIIAGPTGVAPGAHLVSLKLAGADGATEVDQVVEAIEWVVSHRDDPGLDIRVINLAFGTDGADEPSLDRLAQAVDAAWRSGIVVVVAGGNGGAARGQLDNPARDPSVLAVGASDLQGTSRFSDDTVADFSARSAVRPVDLVAPGVSIASLRNPGSTADTEAPSAVVDGRWFRGTGTSQSAAVVSGAVALLLDRRPDLTPDEVKALLVAGADPLESADVSAQGAGRLDVDGAALAPVPAGDTAAGTAPAALAPSTRTSWTGRSWTGRSWTGRSWTGRSWTGRSWTGRSWTGRSWTGRSWTGRSWTGRSWTGRSWTGRSWTGRSWTGRSWTGRSWTGRSWTGRSWTGRSWTGRSWTASAWG